MSMAKNTDSVSYMVWGLILLALLTGGITIGLVAMTLSGLHSEREVLLRDQAQEQRTLDQLNLLEPRAQIEMLKLFREVDHPNQHHQSVQNLVEFIQDMPVTGDEAALNAVYSELKGLAEQLLVLSVQAERWHQQYRQIRHDLQQRKTLGRVRSALQRLQATIDMREGQQRLNEAIQIRRWRVSESQEAAIIAHEILERQGKRWFPLLTEVQVELGDLARLIEILASEEQFDHLVDMRDNLLKPSLERLERNMLILVEQQIFPTETTMHIFTALKDDLFGKGHQIDFRYQTIVATGGLYQLRLDTLELKEKRQFLEQKLQQYYNRISSNYFQLSTLSQEKMHALAALAEERLSKGLRNLSVSGLVAVTIFLLLGGLISTRVKKQVHTLSRLQRQNSLILNSAEEGILGVNTVGCVVFVNQAAAKMLGYSLDEMLGKDLYSFLRHTPEDGSKFEQGNPISSSWTTGSVYQSDNELFWTKEGNHYCVHYSSTPIWNDDELLEGAVLVFRDITQEKQAGKRLQKKKELLGHLAHHDALTGLPNRRLFTDRLHHAIDRAERVGNEVALFFLDLDRFKKINDSLGHEIGDQLLILVAKRLQEHVRSSDTLARLGGDEFVVIIENSQNARQDAVLANTLLKALSKIFSVESRSLYVSASIGISRYPADALDVNGLMSSADAAMYHAKDLGKNNFQFYTPELNARTQELLEMETHLREALEKEQFELYFQPQINLQTKTVVGVEVLLRWHHPLLGMVPPDKFIPLAEETGLILPIGEWVLRTACNWCKQWQEQGKTPIRMAVNISSVQFNQSDLNELIGGILQEVDLAPDWLDLEITESTIMENCDKIVKILDALKQRGLRLSIDDFGTGYSSLSYLKRLPVHQLKIDRSFINDVTTDEDDAAIAISIIALGQTMNLEILAEGVETQEQADFLLQHGCHVAQGYHYGKPMPAQAFETFFVESSTKNH